MHKDLYYFLLQIGSAFIVITILLIVFLLLRKICKLNEIYLASFILIPYFIIALFTYNIRKKRIGARCCDEWNSKATGRGACSGHDGVREWKVKYLYEEYEEPYNTLHKIFYFWYALNEDHIELDYVGGCDEEDYYYEHKGLGTE